MNRFRPLICALSILSLLCCTQFLLPRAVPEAFAEVISVHGLDELPGELRQSVPGDERQSDASARGKGEASPPFLDAGHGYVNFRRTEPCLTDAQRTAMLARVAANIESLTREGRLPPPDPSKIVLFDWPLAAAEGYPHYDYHGISGYIDRDARYPGLLQDYNCGTRTYDLDIGYNHQGTDFFTWPFGWHLMDDDMVHVVAGEGGVIVDKSDGNFDRSCGIGGGDWNAVVVRHADNSLVYYGHMKNGSTTDKPIGTTVLPGEHLGVVGSSGSSTGPHLHMEIYSSAHAVVDPWNGPCNPDPTWWSDQRPYNDSGINALMTHSAPPEFQACPTPAVINAADRFDPGDTVYFAAYYRDQLDDQVSDYRVIRPDETVFSSWQHDSPEPYYPASYWYWPFEIPLDAPLGTWKFEVTYQGDNYVHEFTVGSKVSVAPDEPTPARRPVLSSYPNPFNPSTTIRFEMERAGHARLTIHDVAGRRVAVLVDEIRRSGERFAAWDGRDDSGIPLPSGVYFARLEKDSRMWSRKLVLTK